MSSRDLNGRLPGVGAAVLAADAVDVHAPAGGGVDVGHVKDGQQ